jgi:soluble lytic murein transglycosylase-like protein
MKNAFRTTLGLGLTLVFASAAAANDAAKVSAFVSPSGKVVFTNNIENTPIKAAAIAAAPVVSADPIHALIESIAGTHGVDPALVKAIVKTESGFNRFAVSNKGARGLMQLIPETGARYGVRDFFDPRQNIEGGVRYVKFLLEKFNGNLDLSLAAYNAGENLVQRLGRIPAIPETRDYVRKVRASYGKSSVPAVVSAPAETRPAVQAKPEVPVIYRTIDERGVVHFSNVAPNK